MNIVFLDLNYFQKADEYFDYSVFEALGQVTKYDDTPEYLIAERAKNADVIILLKSTLNSAVIAELKDTRLICKIGTGYDRIDVKAANAHGIAVTNFPGHAANIVAQWTISLLLNLSTNILLYDKAVRHHEWLASHFTYPITEVHNKTIGIIGFGHIGKIVAKLALGLGMKVLINSRYPQPQTGYSFVDTDEIYRQADFISLHCLLNDSTRNMIDEKVFNRMKANSFLINTSRASLVDKACLFEALKNRRIAGAAMDGFWKEPPEKDEPLFSLDNFIITPHVGWASIESRKSLLKHMAETIRDFSAGKAIPVIS